MSLHKHPKIRLGTLKVDKVMPFIGCGFRPEFLGVKVTIDHKKMQVFKLKGFRCVCCGLSAKFFAIERDPHHQRRKKENIRWHLTAYGIISGTNEECAITVDHVIPKSCNNDNTLDNLQPMCFDCNVKKADKIDIELFGFRHIGSFSDVNIDFIDVSSKSKPVIIGLKGMAKYGFRKIGNVEIKMPLYEGEEQ